MGTLQDLRVALKAKFAERSTVVDGLLVALVARETCFLVGPPGTAKSAVCEAITGAIGGTYFQWLLTKFTTPDEVYGPPSFTGLKNDRFERVTTGKLPEASIAFLDEALSLDTPIPTPSGWKNVGQLQVGDFVFGKNGEKTKIVRLTEIATDHDCYKINFNDGESIVADAGHKWLVCGLFPKTHKDKIVSTRDLLSRSIIRMPVCKPVQYAEANLSIDPYLLGLWLGNGNSWTGCLYIRSELVEKTIAELSRIGMIVKSSNPTNDNNSLYTLSLADTGFRSQLGNEGLISDVNFYEGSAKSIPKQYVFSSINQRLRLLQGLMDTDGYINGSTCVFSNTNENIIDNLQEIIRSLGMKCSKTPCKDLRIGARGPHKQCWKLTFRTDSTIPAFLLRANEIPQQKNRRMLRVVSINKVDSVPVRCIEVDNEDHLFLAGKNFCVTHNCFKGSSAILNTLLPVINERKFFNGTSTVSIPLETLYCASNEIPQAEELAALYDRLTLKFEVKRLSGGSFRSFITKDFLKVQIPTLDKGELEKARKATETVTIPDNVLNAIASIAGELEQSGIYVSDRKWFKIIEVLKAYSVLNGATEVAEDDLEIVAHCAWHTPDQFKTVEKIVNKFSNPLGETLLQHRDNLDEVVALLDAGKLNPVEGHKKAMDCSKALKALAAKHPANRKVAETFNYAQAATAKIIKEKLGIDLSI